MRATQTFCPNCKGLIRKNGTHMYCLDCGKKIQVGKDETNTGLGNGEHSFLDFFDHLDGDDEFDGLYEDDF